MSSVLDTFNDDGKSEDSQGEAMQRVDIQVTPAFMDWAAFAAQSDQDLRRRDLGELFRHYDKDSSGSIDLEELQELWRIEFGDKPQMKVIEFLVHEVDKNCDGNISEDEFIDFFGHVESLNMFKAVADSKSNKGGVYRLFMLVRVDSFFYIRTLNSFQFSEI